MSLSHFDPLANLRAFEDAFTRVLSEPQLNRPWAPSVDIFETENELVFKADVPDVDLKDIDVRVENQTLTLAGERNDFGSVPDPERLCRADRITHIASRQMSVVLFDHAGVGMAEVTGYYHQRHPVHHHQRCIGMAQRVE